MSKNKLKHFFLTVICLTGLAMMFSGCVQNDSDSVSTDPYKYYNQVELDQSKEDVARVLNAVPEELGGTFTYIDSDTGYGVTVTYDTDDRVGLKTLYMPIDNDFSGYSKASVTEEQAAVITPGMTYAEVVTQLGEGGLEIVSSTNPEDETQPIYAIAWINDDASSIVVTLIGFEGTVYDATYINN